jgi:hypothetical protein
MQSPLSSQPPPPLYPRLLLTLYSYHTLPFLYTPSFLHTPPSPLTCSLFTPLPLCHTNFHAVLICSSFIQCHLFRCCVEELYKITLCKNCIRLITEMLICSPPSPLNPPPSLYPPPPIFSSLSTHIKLSLLFTLPPFFTLPHLFLLSPSSHLFLSDTTFHAVLIYSSFIFRCYIEELYKMTVCKSCMGLITELLICSPPSPLNPPLYTPLPPPSPHSPLLSNSPFYLHSLISSQSPLSSYFLLPHTSSSLSYNLPCSPYLQSFIFRCYIEELYKMTVCKSCMGLIKELLICSPPSPLNPPPPLHLLLTFHSYHTLPFLYTPFFLYTPPSPLTCSLLTPLPLCHTTFHAVLIYSS